MWTTTTCRRTRYTKKLINTQLFQQQRSEKWKSLTFEEHIKKHLDEVQNLLKRRILNDTAIQEFAKDPNLSLYAYGAYSSYLRLWMASFPRDRIKIIQGEALFKNPSRVLESTQNFLSIPIILKEKDFIRSDEYHYQCLKPWWMVDQDPSNSSTLLKWSNKTPFLCYIGGAGEMQFTDRNLLPSEFAAGTLKKFYDPYNRDLFTMIKTKWRWKKNFSKSSLQRNNSSNEYFYIP